MAKCFQIDQLKANGTLNSLNRIQSTVFLSLAALMRCTHGRVCGQFLCFCCPLNMSRGKFQLNGNWCYLNRQLLNSTVLVSVIVPAKIK